MLFRSEANKSCSITGLHKTKVSVIFSSRRLPHTIIMIRIRSLLTCCLLSIATCSITMAFVPIGTHQPSIMRTAEQQQSVSRLQGFISPPEERPRAFGSVLTASATPLEVWLAEHLEDWYSTSLTIKCPFFRRRAADALDSLDMMCRFLLIRHKSLDLPLGCRATIKTKEKTPDLHINEIFYKVLGDWKTDTDKGYYITGRLNTTIYRDDCLFDGPDPDMPVRGLRKYLNAASQLFDYHKSHAELLSLEIVHDKLFVAEWKMEGVLRLPWKPLLPEWTGRTLYHLDEDNLVFIHEETWDMSVAEAFIKTFTPQIGYKIWNAPCVHCED